MTALAAVLEKAYALTEQAAAMVSESSVEAHAILAQLNKRRHPQDPPTETGVRAARLAYALEHIADSLHMSMTELDEALIDAKAQDRVEISV